MGVFKIPNVVVDHRDAAPEEIEHKITNGGTERNTKEPVGWVFDPPRQCGGVFTNGIEPKCCEVHMAPWGHARPECVQ